MALSSPGKFAKASALIVRSGSSFAVLHTFHTLIAVGFALVQLLIFARTLDVQRFAEMVFFTSIGIFLLPISAAAGRANYSALRSDIISGTLPPRDWPVVLSSLTFQFIVLNGLSLLAWFFPATTSIARIENVLFLNACLIGNYWLNEVQPTAWSVDLRPKFLLFLIARIIGNYSAALYLFLSGSLTSYLVLTFLVNCVFLVIFVSFFTRNAGFRTAIHRADLTFTRIASYARRLLASLTASVTELVVLSLPYALITLAFGIGPALITYDTIMKLVRLVASFARTLMEIALRRITRSIHAGLRRPALRTYLLTLGTCLAGTLPLSVALVLWGPDIFGILLGPSNVVPAEAAPAAAIIVLFGALFQPALSLISYQDARHVVWRLTLVGLVGFGLFAAVTVSGLSLPNTIWAFTLFFGAVTIAALLLSRRAILDAAAAAAAPQKSA